MMKPCASKRQSRGLTVVAVLVCLVILTLLSGAALKIALAQRELARAHERRLQAGWLVESGLERAVARLTRDHSYRGETWTITAGDLGLPAIAPADRTTAADQEKAAVVKIAVEPVANQSNGRRVRVQADFPPDLPRRVRQTKEIKIELEPSP
jgi:Tfp pilus assembly protein PilX